MSERVVHRLAANLLRRHIADGSEQRARARVEASRERQTRRRARVEGDQLRQAEVEDLDPLLLA